MYITKEGLKKLKEELTRRKLLRVEIAKKIQEAKALGDLAENAEYQEALSLQSFNEGRILEIQEIVKNSKVIEGEGNHKHNKVEIGSQVKVESKFGVEEFTIVSPSETSPSQGFISNESILGKAFLGRKVGDEVEVIIPRGKVKYKILEII